MKRYHVNDHYRSAWGGLTKDTVVELDDDTAAWLLRDAPGIITLEAPPEPVRSKAAWEDKMPPGVVKRRVRPPGATNRMVTGPEKDR